MADSTIQFIQKWEADNHIQRSPFSLPPHVLQKAQQPFLEIKDPTPGIVLSEEQIKVREKIIHWIINPTDTKRWFKVGGYAGTGKSLTLKHTEAYLRAIGLSHSVSAYTGKATSVLRKKGCKDACTIHSLMYEVDQEAAKAGFLRFTKASHINQKVLLIDEGSMLSKEIKEDMESYPGVRMLVFGDHGQIPPIGDDPDIMRFPDVKLEQIHRQALGSGIIELATLIRKGKPLCYGSHLNVAVRPKKEFFDRIYDPVFDQIIVGFNRTRHRVNIEVRRVNGHYGKTPDPGEKIIILNNNAELGLYNGMMGIVTNSKVVSKEIVVLDLEADDRNFTQIPFLIAQFGAPKLDYRDIGMHLLQGRMLADYGPAITLHKALGSEWDRVLILEELHPEWERRLWSYTGVTRAKIGAELYLDL